MKRLSLRFWLALLIGAAVVPLLGLLGYRAWVDAEANAERAQARLQLAAEQISRKTGAQLAEIRGQLATLAQHPEVQALDPSHCDPIFGEGIALFPRFANVLSVDATGRLVCSMVPPAAGRPAAVDPKYYLAEVLRTREFTVGKPAKGFVTGRWVVTLARPILSPTGEVKGVLGVSLDLLSFWSGPNALDAPMNSRVRIFDHQGTILATTDESTALVGSQARAGMLKFAQENAQGTTRDVDRYGVERFYAVARIAGAPWYVSVGIPTSVVFEQTQRPLVRDAAVTLAVALLALILAYLLARRIVGPVESIAGALKRWAASGTRTSAPVGGPSEVAALAEEFASVVTQLERAETARQASAEQARTILRTAQEGVVISDQGGRLIEANPAYAAMVGYSVEELGSMHIVDLDASESPEAIADHLRQLAERGEGRFETRHRRKDGSIIDVEVSVRVQPDGRFVSFVHDITARNRAQATLLDHQRELESQVAERTAQLAASEQRWKFALEGAAQGVWDWDLPSHKVYYSPQYKAMLGYAAEDIGDDEEEWSGRLHPEDRSATLAEAERHFRGEIPSYSLEFRMRRKDGSYAWIESRGLIVERTADGAPKRAIGTHVDITERKRSEEALRALTQDLEAQVAERTAQLTKASAAKSEFLAHMSHEIRTPLNVVLSLTRSLEDEPLTPVQSEVVRTIAQAGQSLLQIIDDILDFSKIEAGQLKVEHRPFELSDVLDQVEALLREAAARKGLVFSVVPPRQPLQPLDGDALRLKQVLINFLNNAIKFTDRGSVSLAATVLEETVQGVRLRFEVTDTGIGIAPEVIPTLFRPFIQASSGITRRFGGTGLGLSICKRVGEMMGGSVGCASRLGAGSTFWFEVSLPWAAKEPGAGATPANEARGTEPRLAGLRVLVVDDNQMNLFAAERLLGKQGAVVALAADGQQALQMLRAQPKAFDVVLMDIQMPVMDGLTATRLIRAEPDLAALPIIALTAGVLAEERESALAAGVDDFLPKPLDLKQMVATLSSFRAGRARRPASGDREA